MRLPLALRVQMYLLSHPHAANRLFKRLGARWIEAASRRAALRAARLAFERVPFYRQLYARHGISAEHMRRLTWKDFLLLPTVSKVDTEGSVEQELLDTQVPSPLGDALIGRSSGTLHGPIFWPLGWSEFYLSRAAFEAILRNLGTANGVPTVVIHQNTVDGGDQSGAMPYRTFFSIKEHRAWSLEIIATGEESAVTHEWLRWCAKAGFKALILFSFPGTLERLFKYIASLPEDQRVNWSAFERKHIMIGGQLVVRPIREMIHREMGLDPGSLISETYLYISSDTGQYMARSTPFTIWLERYLAVHPELYDALGLREDHREKPWLEFIPPFSMYFEFERPEGLVLTMWKHRPLIRYKIGDMVWVRSMRTIADLLDKATPAWRQDFQRAGGHPGDLPSIATLGVVLGRADEICIVNAANVSPAMVEQALTAARIAPQIHHFKHHADPAHPNAYSLFLELQEPLDEQARRKLEEEWREPLLNALIEVPAASDLAAAHRANPIQLILSAHSPGEGPFEGDEKRHKKTYALRADYPAHQKG